MEQINTTALRNLGLSKGEITVYLSLLKQGTVQANSIIKDTKLQSSSIYHILDALIVKGIVAIELRNNRKQFSATSPPQLITILDEKKQQIEQHKIEIQALIPQLLALQAIEKNKSNTHQQIRIFEGWNGMHSAFKEAYSRLIPGTTIYAYTITKGYGGADPKQVRWLINKIRELREEMNKKNKKKTRMYVIAEENSPIGIDQSKTTYTKVKFVDKSHINTAIINIYGEITIIALWLKTPIAIVIESQEVAQSFKNNFDLLWDISK